MNIRILGSRIVSSIVAITMAAVGIVALAPVLARGAQSRTAIVGAGISVDGDFVALAFTDLDRLPAASLALYGAAGDGAPVLIQVTCVAIGDPEQRDGRSLVVHASGYGDPEDLNAFTAPGERDAFLIEIVVGIGDPNLRDAFGVVRLGPREIPEGYGDPEERCGAEGVEVSPLRAGAFVSIGDPEE